MLLVHFLALLAGSLAASAQSDTAHHRAVYAEIDAAAASMQKVAATHKDEETDFALTGWFDGGEWRKIIAKCADDGEGVEEFYLEDEKPLFVLSSYFKSGDEEKKGARIEERLYFKDGGVFKWLTTEKPAPVFHGEDYQATTARLVGNCASFVAALKKARPAAKDKPAGQQTEGTFTGIEEGDYAHWQMKGKDGKERSFFILKTDAALDKVLKNPKAHIGKACRLTWKKSSETIPEAGGKIEIEQILGVEWLEKK